MPVGTREERGRDPAKRAQASSACVNSWNHSSRRPSGILSGMGIARSAAVVVLGVAGLVAALVALAGGKDPEPDVPCAAIGAADRNPDDAPVAPRHDRVLVPRHAGAAPFGFNDSAFLVGQLDLETDLELHRGAGSTLIRLPLDWGAVERAPGEVDFSRYDEIYCASLAAGVLPLFHLTGAPAWAADPALGACAGPPCVIPPARDRLGDWRDFAERVAIRYPRAAAIEIWNEPNLKDFWPTPDPWRYSELLATAYAGVKAGNPATPVLGGALAGNQRDVPGGSLSLTTFLQAMSAAGAGRYMDALSLHPYPTAPLGDPGELLTPVLAQAQAVAAQSPRWPDRIWVTETGIPTAPAPSFSRVVSPEDQAAETVAILETLRRAGNVDAVLFHTLVDPNAAVPGGGGFGWLTDPARGLAAKPVYCEFARRSGNHSPLC